MNYKQKKESNRKLKEQITQPFRLRGINTKNTIEHETVKFQVAYLLSKQNWEIYLESPCGSARPDIIAIKNQHGYCIEILHSESEKRFEAKFGYYPDGFDIIRVDTKDFNPETWCL
jgi:hypothetical protein